MLFALVVIYGLVASVIPVVPQQYVCNDTSTQEEAEGKCKHIGGNLVYPAENSTPKSQSCDSVPIWTGGHRINETYWAWMEGSKIRKLRTKALINSKYSSDDEQYGCAFMEAGKVFSTPILNVYHRKPCNDKLHFICMNRQCHKETGGCTSYFNQSRSWYEALVECKSHEQDLLTLPLEFEDAEEDDRYNMIKNYIDEDQLERGITIWIGLRYISWQWSTGEPIISPDLPDLIDDDNVVGDCLITAGTGLQPVPCNHSYSFVCAFDISESTGSKDAPENDWIIPVCVTLSLVILLLLVIIFVMCWLKKRRTSTSPTEAAVPEGVNAGYEEVPPAPTTYQELVLNPGDSSKTYQNVPNPEQSNTYEELKQS